MTEGFEVGLIAAGAAIAGGILSGAYQHVRDWLARPKLLIGFSQDGPGHVVEGAWRVGEDKDESGFMLVRPGSEMLARAQPETAECLP